MWVHVAQIGMNHVIHTGRSLRADIRLTYTCQLVNNEIIQNVMWSILMTIKPTCTVGWYDTMRTQYLIRHGC